MVIYTDLSFGIALSALMICLANLVYTIMDGHTKKPQNRIFILLLSLLSVNAICELVNIRVSEDVMISERIFFISRLSKYIYFLSHSLIAPALFYYLSFVVGRNVKIEFKRQASQSSLGYIRSIALWAVVIISELVIAFNPLTNWCWYYTSGRQFHRAWGEYIFIYLLSGFWSFAAFILVMMSWNILTKSRKRSIAVCFFLAMSGVIIQLFYMNFRVEVLLESVGFSGALLFIENEDDRKDVELNAYNSAAFLVDMKATLKNHIPVQIMIVRGIRFDKTANTVVYGKMNRDVIIRSVSDYLGTVVKQHYIYYLGHGRFAVALYGFTDEKSQQLAKKVLSRFGAAWKINGTDIFLSVRILLVRMPERAKNAEEVIYIAECPIPERVQERIIDGKSLDWVIRRAAVEKAVTNGLEHGSFEVYYQPTYNIDKTLHGAEALLRMNNEKMGLIYPDEFIPIAEQLGIIDRIDEFVLKEVCRFIYTGIPEKNGMTCINVNLSVQECMKEGFAEHISSVVEAESVPKNMINFEITESVAAKDYTHLAEVIDRLKKEGFRFSIDDYGTGYSNMTSLFSLGVDIIKIDKSILWNSEKSVHGMTLLVTLIEMIHKMDKRALMEGVETESQINILKKLGCDYMQGYYFSKPIARDDFIKLIETKSFNN